MKSFIAIILCLLAVTVFGADYIDVVTIVPSDSLDDTYNLPYGANVNYNFGVRTDLRIGHYEVNADYNIFVDINRNYLKAIVGDDSLVSCVLTYTGYTGVGAGDVSINVIAAAVNYDVVIGTLNAADGDSMMSAADRGFDNIGSRSVLGTTWGTALKAYPNGTDTAAANIAVYCDTIAITLGGTTVTPYPFDITEGAQAIIDSSASCILLFSDAYEGTGSTYRTIGSRETATPAYEPYMTVTVRKSISSAYDTLQVVALLCTDTLYNYPVDVWLTGLSVSDSDGCQFTCWDSTGGWHTVPMSVYDNMWTSDADSVQVVIQPDSILYPYSLVFVSARQISGTPSYPDSSIGMFFDRFNGSRQNYTNETPATFDALLYHLTIADSGHYEYSNPLFVGDSVWVLAASDTTEMDTLDGGLNGTHGDMAIVTSLNGVTSWVTTDSVLADCEDCFGWVDGDTLNWLCEGTTFADDTVYATEEIHWNRSLDGGLTVESYRTVLASNSVPGVDYWTLHDDGSIDDTELHLWDSNDNVSLSGAASPTQLRIVVDNEEIPYTDADGWQWWCGEGFPTAGYTYPLTFAFAMKPESSAVLVYEHPLLISNSEASGDNKFCENGAVPDYWYVNSDTTIFTIGFHGSNATFRAGYARGDSLLDSGYQEDVHLLGNELSIQPYWHPTDRVWYAITDNSVLDAVKANRKHYSWVAELVTNDSLAFSGMEVLSGGTQDLGATGDPDSARVFQAYAKESDGNLVFSTSPDRLYKWVPSATLLRIDTVLTTGFAIEYRARCTTTGIFGYSGGSIGSGGYYEGVGFGAGQLCDGDGNPDLQTSYYHAALQDGYFLMKQHNLWLLREASSTTDTVITNASSFTSPSFFKNIAEAGGWYSARFEYGSDDTMKYYSDGYSANDSLIVADYDATYGSDLYPFLATGSSNATGGPNFEIDYLLVRPYSEAVGDAVVVGTLTATPLTNSTNFSFSGWKWRGKWRW